MSNELETAKPSKNIFEIAIKKLMVPSQEIFHIGDNYTADILGSKNCGFNSIWINNKNNSKNKDLTISNITEIENFVNL